MSNNKEKVDADQYLNHKIVETQSYQSLKRVMQGKNPLNIFIDGPTGQGKSSAVIDICNKARKKVIPLSMSESTDVDDLLGGMRLDGGDTKYEDGPAIKAMEEGCVLLLDEMDAAPARVHFDIQQMVAGNGIYLKKSNRMVYPKKGFQVIATGNTKGRGDLTGEHIGTNVLNKAFLDRFAISITFTPPDGAEMVKIITTNFPKLDLNIVEALSIWHEKIVSAYDSETIDDILSTRRMLDICALIENFGAKAIDDQLMFDAIDYCTNTFHEEFKDSLRNLYQSHLDDLQRQKEEEARKKREAEEARKKEEEERIEHEREAKAKKKAEEALRKEVEQMTKDAIENGIDVNTSTAMDHVNPQAMTLDQLEAFKKEMLQAEIDNSFVHSVLKGTEKIERFGIDAFGESWAQTPRRMNDDDPFTP